MSRGDGKSEGELLVQAIQEHRLVGFVYGGYRRVVEPHLLGIHEAGEAILSGYQVEGGSHTGELPGWRTFVLSEIGRIELLDRSFESPRPEYNREAPGLTEIFARA